MHLHDLSGESICNDAEGQLNSAWPEYLVLFLTSACKFYTLILRNGKIGNKDFTRAEVKT